MDRTTFKVLDTLARDPARPVSIRELTMLANRAHGSAYYANIYHCICRLEKEGVVSLQVIGRARAVSLDFRSNNTAELLGELERKKAGQLYKKSATAALLAEQLKPLTGLPLFRCLAIVDPTRNLTLNRAELLVILSGTPGSKEKIPLYQALRGAEKQTALKIDPLILSEEEFRELSVQAALPADMIKKQAAILRPEEFWETVGSAIRTGARFVGEQDPVSLPEKTLVYNLARFGYRELGRQVVGQVENVGAETVIVAALLSGSARLRGSVPVLFVKTQPNISLLLFLCKKYRLLETVLGMLEAMGKVQPAWGEKFIMLLRETGVKAKKADAVAVRSLLKVYHGR